MSQAKFTHVQTLRAQTETVHNDLNAEFLALSKVTREGLLMSAGRIVTLEREVRLLVAGLVLAAAVLVLHVLA